MDEALRLIITNILSFAAFFLVLLDTVQLEKNSVVRLKMTQNAICALMYIVGGMYSALVGKVFSLLRGFAVLKLKGDTRMEKAALAICVSGGIVFSFATAYLSEADWTGYLPTMSILVSSCGLVFCKTAKQIRILYGLNALVIWLPFDFANVLVGGMVQDLFQIMMPIAAKYVSADTLNDRNCNTSSHNF